MHSFFCCCHASPDCKKPRVDRDDDRAQRHQRRP
jgi:hypothetical protein